MSEPQMLAERKRYMTEAVALAQQLRAQQAASPPNWNPPTGDAEVDALVWFRYVESDAISDARIAASDADERSIDRQGSSRAISSSATASADPLR